MSNATQKITSKKKKTMRSLFFSFKLTTCRKRPLKQTCRKCIIIIGVADVCFFFNVIFQIRGS